MARQMMMSIEPPPDDGVWLKRYPQDLDAGIGVEYRGAGTRRFNSRAERGFNNRAEVARSMRVMILDVCLAEPAGEVRIRRPRIPGERMARAFCLN